MASTESPLTHGHGATHEHGGANPNTASPFHIHHPKPITYFITFGLLMVLLLMTVGAYEIDVNKYTGWSWPNIIIAMTIAIAKAALVVLFFMNVRGSTKLTWLWAAIGFIWLIFLSGIFVDYQTRSWIDQSGWQQTPSEYPVQIHGTSH